MKRVLSLLLGMLLLAAAPAAQAATSYTSCLLIPKPQVGDTGWGITTTTATTLTDSAIAGILTKSVAGSADVVLTSTSGAPDEARNQHFVFTGVLTGNIRVFWPAGLYRIFSVQNGTSGAFSLTVAADNGAHSPAGTTVAVPQGSSVILVSDGTNIAMRGNAVVGGLTLPTPLTAANGGTGAATLAANNVLLGNGTSALQAVAPGSAGNALVSNGTTWQSVGFRGALAWNSANQSIPTGGSPTVLNLDSETYDTDSIHSTVSNTSRLTVPVGVTRVRLRGQAAFAGAAGGSRYADVVKNGGSFPGMPSAEVGASSAQMILLVSSPVLIVTAGDFFQLRAFQDSGGALNVLSAGSGADTWFAMEIVQ